MTGSVLGGFEEYVRSWPEVLPPESGFVGSALEAGAYLGAVRYEGLSDDEQQILLDHRGLNAQGFGKGSGRGVEVCCHRADSGCFTDKPLGELEFIVHDSAEGLKVAGYRMAAEVRLGGLVDADVWFDKELEAWISSLHLLNLLRIVTAFQLPKERSLMLHSAGIIVNEEAYLFLGRSGAGKSTLSELSDRLGYGVLSDDINIIKVDDGGRLLACPSGFFGTYRSGELQSTKFEFPVKGLFILGKAGENLVSRASTGSVVAQMLVNSPFLNQSEPRLAELTELLCEFASKVSLGRLDFKKDEDPWPLLIEFANGK